MTDTHTGFVGYAIVMLCVYPFGIPLLYAYLLFKVYGKQLNRLRDIEIAYVKLGENASAQDVYGRWSSETGEAAPIRHENEDAVENKIVSMQEEEFALRSQLPGYMQSLSGGGYALRGAAR